MFLIHCHNNNINNNNTNKNNVTILLPGRRGEFLKSLLTVQDILPTPSKWEFWFTKQNETLMKPGSWDF